MIKAFQQAAATTGAALVTQVFAAPLPTQMYALFCVVVWVAVFVSWAWAMHKLVTFE